VSTQVFKVGGAQAIAAMAYGTASIPKCDKLFGPGNAWVTAAKLLVAQDADGAAADLPAGVSEVMVIADDSARADFVAADLLAQAEHSPDAQALLVTNSKSLANRSPSRSSYKCNPCRARKYCASPSPIMRLVVVDSGKSLRGIANDYAPEHLILEIRDARAWLSRVSAAGAVFLGSWSPESMGDYCSGPNHTLPTYGYAKAYSGLSLEDFQKRITVQELIARGTQRSWPHGANPGRPRGTGRARRGGHHSPRRLARSARRRIMSALHSLARPEIRHAEALLARGLAALADAAARQ
jgi:histidinol dehydrogenase